MSVVVIYYLSELSMKNIAIIGAGLGGMSAAWDLAHAGHNVTIYEAADQVGGLASGFKEPQWDWSVEKFYHHWFQSDDALLGLAEELGLRQNILFPRPYTVLFHKGEWHPFDSILAALKYPGLGFGINKLRFGFVGLYLRMTNNWQALEKHTAHEWIRKYAGQYVYNTMWEPMLIGKFGPYYKDVNMAWFWARLKARTPRLGTYQGGFQQFADDFATKLRAKGVKIVLNTPVTRIASHPQDAQPLSVYIGDAHHTYDQVLVTTSPGLMARLAPDLPQEYLAGLRALKSMGAVVMVLSIKRQLSEQGYYWYNIPKNEGFPFLALVEHTNYVSPENFGGEHILYCGDYLEEGHEYFDLSKEALLERFIPAIARINPKFDRAWINKTWLFRAKYAQPVPLVNHSHNIPTIPTPLDGLYFASMSQVYPWDRGTNFAVQIGRRAATLMENGK